MTTKSDTIHTDAKWQEWNFEKLLEALREYTLRNPERVDNKQFQKERFRKEKHFGRTNRSTNVCIVTQRNTKAVTVRKSMLSVKEENFSRRTGYVITALVNTRELQSVEAEIVVDVVRNIIHPCALKKRRNLDT